MKTEFGNFNKKDEKMFCTDCGAESFVMFTSWKDDKGNQIVGKDESICNSCMRKRNKTIAI